MTHDGGEQPPAAEGRSSWSGSRPAWATAMLARGSGGHGAGTTIPRRVRRRVPAPTCGLAHVSRTFTFCCYTLPGRERQSAEIDTILAPRLC